MTISQAYAELGGGVNSPSPRRRRQFATRAPSVSPGEVCDEHMFDPVSGWCGCGIRDDGAIAPGSPAWRTSIERQMPGKAT